MLTDKDLEDLLRQVRLSTTAEQDERILADALASIGQSAADHQSKPLPTKLLPTATDDGVASTRQPTVFPLRTLARALRRHWRASIAAACVLVLLAVLPLTLPPAELPDSGEADEVAVVTEPPENPGRPTRGTKGGHTPHKWPDLAGRPKTDAAGKTRNLLRGGSTAPGTPTLARQPKHRAAAVARGNQDHEFGIRAAPRNTTFGSLHLQGAGRTKVGGTRPDDRTPAAEAAWGAAVEGVQVRLRARQSNWNEGAVSRLSADVHNQGKRNLLVRTRDHGCELEVDGRWYCQPPRGGTIPPPRPLPPGRRHDDIAVDLGPWWQPAAARIARGPWENGPRQFGKLTPGKHTIRVAFMAMAAENARGSAFKAVSNPVEIEIVATGAKPDDPTTAVPPAEPSPKSGRPDGDKDLEKAAVFDMEEVEPLSEPKLRAMIGSSLIPAVARKGQIEIGGRQHTALLAQLGTTTGSFDKPETLLLLTPGTNPTHSYHKFLGAIRTVGGKYYKISATPTGDKLTITPCGDNVGILRVGVGGRDVQKWAATYGVLVAKKTLVPLGKGLAPAPAEDPGQMRIPVGDYAPEYLRLVFGNVGVNLRPNGPPAYNIKIRKDKPFTLNFSAKGNLLLTSPSATQTFKPGSSVPLVARIVDPELNLMVNAWDRKGSHDPTVVIRDSSGKQVAESKMPFC